MLSGKQDRHSNRRSAAADDGAERDRDAADVGGKRRRVEPKSEGGGASPGHGAAAGRGGSITPDVGTASRRCVSTKLRAGLHRR